MATKPLLKVNTIKTHINETQGLRSSKEAVEILITAFGKVLREVITEAGKLAQEDDRKTIQEEDIEQALEKSLANGSRLGKKPPNPS